MGGHGIARGTATYRDAGRLADRHGQRAVLIPGVLVHTASGLTLTALALD